VVFPQLELAVNVPRGSLLHWRTRFAGGSSSEWDYRSGQAICPVLLGVQLCKLRRGWISPACRDSVCDPVALTTSQNKLSSLVSRTCCEIPCMGYISSPQNIRTTIFLSSLKVISILYMAYSFQQPHILTVISLETNSLQGIAWSTFTFPLLIFIFIHLNFACSRVDRTQLTWAARPDGFSWFPDPRDMCINCQLGNQIKLTLALD